MYTTHINIRFLFVSSSSLPSCYQEAISWMDKQQSTLPLSVPRSWERKFLAEWLDAWATSFKWNSECLFQPRLRLIGNVLFLGLLSIALYLCNLDVYVCIICVFCICVFLGEGLWFCYCCLFWVNWFVMEESTVYTIYLILQSCVIFISVWQSLKKSSFAQNVCIH